MGEGRQVPFGAQSRGHRFLAPAAFDIIGFDDYRVKLHGAKVMLDPAERRALIARQAAALASEAGVKVKDDAGLLDEVTGLVEWPQVLMGRVDSAFLDLPAEVLSTSMRSHQKDRKSAGWGTSVSVRVDIGGGRIIKKKKKKKNKK